VQPGQAFLGERLSLGWKILRQIERTNMEVNLARPPIAFKDQQKSRLTPDAEKEITSCPFVSVTRVIPPP
jgi:hypothetical protein